MLTIFVVRALVYSQINCIAKMINLPENKFKSAADLFRNETLVAIASN